VSVKIYKKKAFFFFDFSTSHCHTFNVAHQKYPKKLGFTPDGLKYYFIKFIHGGTFKKSKKCEDVIISINYNILSIWSTVVYLLSVQPWLGVYPQRKIYIPCYNYK